MTTAPTRTHAGLFAEGRPAAVGAAHRARSAVEGLLEQAEHLDINSPIATLARWRAAALIVIRTLCPPDHIAWQMLRPATPWSLSATAEGTDREQVFAEGWSITLGVLQGLLPSLMGSEPNRRALDCRSVQQDEMDAWASTSRSGPSPGIELVVLGTPQVRGAQGPCESRRISRLTESAMWLHLNPGSDRHALDGALWPGRRIRADSRNTAMSRLRAWLGPAHFPKWTVESQYILASSVTSDWQQFQELAARGQDDASPGGIRDLRAALDLVDGQPFAGVISQGWYEWAEPYVQEMTRAIAHVAQQLAHQYLELGDLPAARWSVQSGYLALPKGLQRFEAAADAIGARYSDPDGLRYLAGQLIRRPFPEEDSVQPFAS
ncbi:AfsR/SARP family transcriptional regulator [Streptomyces sp. 5.8]|uniref:AfsR/SARP family transcriptional regulator n=1 Tax=Streptomyces sp. 5.8 TaxID=3406571 RepID=UPI003BB63B86